MDKTDYVGEAERQLANQVHYKRLEEPVFPKSMAKINDIFESLANRRFIDAGQLSYLILLTNGLEAVKQIFSNNPDPKRPDKELLELLKINLENNDFEFNSQWYLQTWGTSISEKCAPNYAHLFLRGKSIRKMRPKTLSVLEVPG